MALRGLFCVSVITTLVGKTVGNLGVEPKCHIFDFEERLLEKMVQMEQSVKLMDDRIDILNKLVLAVKHDMGKLEHETDTELDRVEGLVQASKSGATYIRWGRSNCPGNGSSDVYSGYAGGSFYSHKGAAASMVCLPKDPIWKNYDDATQAGGLMYGAEYDDKYIGERWSSLVGKDNYEKDVPCAVCNVNGRSSTMMIPGRSECYPGWTLEFWGYLMSGHYDFTGATNYYCVDADQEAIVGRGKNDNGYLLYFVEGRCGSLPCPPYVNGRELTCVVCTK